MEFHINKKKWQRYGMVILAVFFMALSILSLEEWLLERSRLSRLSGNTVESGLYRAQMFSEEGIKWLREFSKKEKLPAAKVAAAVMPELNFDMTSFRPEGWNRKAYERLKKRWSVKKEGYRNLLKANEAIFGDLKYFPVPDSTTNQEATTAYDNSWQFERTYGGKRGHEGTDIMAGINKRGYYPIVSMTDGVIEKIGWLEKGGYRIGIRAPHGGYFYYAHLDSYADEFKEGDKIKAGQLIGYMGDSGYGKKEGTVGKFPVHLHLGIYIRTGNYEELSVNPYWVLKFVDDKRLSSSF